MSPILDIHKSTEGITTFQSGRAE